MTSYEEAGVNVEKGDEASRLAYMAAKSTFPGRTSGMGVPVVLEGGFSGALDMGDYYLLQNDDGVGSKAVVAQLMGHYDTLGRDLVAMVADDAICVGAEVISVSNTIDVEKVDPIMIGAMMEGLKAACLEQKIVVPGGEIAEMPDQVRGFIWNATAVGVVEKEKFIDGSRVKEGDWILGIRSENFRSNGLTLVRRILEKKFGPDWVGVDYSGGTGSGRSWGEMALQPCEIYHRALLGLLGTFGEARKVDIHGLAHITGGGLYNNVARVVREERGLRADFDALWEAPEMMLKLMEIGEVSREEAYRTWNMGTGMALLVDEKDAPAVVDGLKGLRVERIGRVVKA